MFPPTSTPVVGSDAILTATLFPFVKPIRVAVTVAAVRFAVWVMERFERLTFEPFSVWIAAFDVERTDTKAFVSLVVVGTVRLDMPAFKEFSAGKAAVVAVRLLVVMFELVILEAPSVGITLVIA